jgi:hypothetical protein
MRLSINSRDGHPLKVVDHPADTYASPILQGAADMSKLHRSGLLLAAFAFGILFEHSVPFAAAAKQSKPAIADTLVAHRIALVDSLGQTAGTFVAEPDGLGGSAVALYDGHGQLVWRAGGGPQLLSVGH